MEPSQSGRTQLTPLQEKLRTFNAYCRLGVSLPPTMKSFIDKTVLVSTDLYNQIKTFAGEESWDPTGTFMQGGAGLRLDTKFIFVRENEDAGRSEDSSLHFGITSLRKLEMFTSNWTSYGHNYQDLLKRQLEWEVAYRLVENGRLLLERPVPGVEINSVQDVQLGTKDELFALLSAKRLKLVKDIFRSNA